MSKEEITVTEDRIIVVEPIDKDRPFFKAGHDGKIRYTGCTTSYTLPWKNSTRSFVKIFEAGEQEAFEKALELEPGTLNLYKRKGSWWSKFNIFLDKNEKTLDLNSPLQALEYRVLLANKDSFIKTKSEYNGIQDYILIDQRLAKEGDYKAAEKTEAAMDFFIKIRRSNKSMYDALRVMGLRPSKDMASNAQALKTELHKVIQQVEKVRGLPNIDDFLAVSEDKLYTDKVFVLDAIDIGAIEMKGDTFKLAESGIPLGRSLQEVAEYFHSAKNQEDKLLIQRRIEMNK